MEQQTKKSRSMRDLLGFLSLALIVFSVTLFHDNSVNFWNGYLYFFSGNLNGLPKVRLYTIVDVAISALRIFSLLIAVTAILQFLLKVSGEDGDQTPGLLILIKNSLLEETITRVLPGLGVFFPIPWLFYTLQFVFNLVWSFFHSLNDDGRIVNGKNSLITLIGGTILSYAFALYAWPVTATSLLDHIIGILSGATCAILSHLLLNFVGWLTRWIRKQ